MWAISRKKKFSSLSYNEAFGISPDYNQWFPWGEMDGITETNGIELAHFHKEKIEVDLLLDIDKKELRFGVVGEKENNKEAIISKIEYPDKQNKGFVPHINFGGNLYAKPTKVQIAKIPVEMYRESYDDIFTIDK